MKDLFALLSAAGVGLLLAVGMAVGGVLRRQRKLLLLACLALIGSGGLAARAGYIFVHKAKSRLASALKPRPKDDIYVALFGQSPLACTQVLAAQDQVVPRIDDAIWLHFTTCPGEFKRLLGRHPFEGGKEPTAQWHEAIPGAENMQWFRPQALGDTILVYEYTTEHSRNIQTFWASRDSTEVFYRDIAD